MLMLDLLGRLILRYRGIDIFDWLRVGFLIRLKFLLGGHLLQEHRACERLRCNCSLDRGLRVVTGQCRLGLLLNQFEGAAFCVLI